MKAKAFLKTAGCRKGWADEVWGGTDSPACSSSQDPLRRRLPPPCERTPQLQSELCHLAGAAVVYLPNYVWLRTMLKLFFLSLSTQSRGVGGGGWGSARWQREDWALKAVTDKPHAGNQELPVQSPVNKQGSGEVGLTPCMRESWKEGTRLRGWGPSRAPSGGPSQCSMHSGAENFPFLLLTLLCLSHP